MPQGSIISPVLFPLFLNNLIFNLKEKLKNDNVDFVFADDISFIASYKKKSGIIILN